MTTPEFFEQERTAGLWEADLQRRQVGWYTSRVVLDELPVAELVSDSMAMPLRALKCHEETLTEPIPRYADVLVWRSRVDGSEVEA